MKINDRIYFLIDASTEIAGTVLAFNEKSGRVKVSDDDDGAIFYGDEENTRPNDDITEG